MEWEDSNLLTLSRLECIINPNSLRDRRDCYSIFLIYAIVITFKRMNLFVASK